MRLKTSFITLACLAITHLFISQISAQPVKFSNPVGMSPTKGYSHLVAVDLGDVNIIIMSGQISLDSLGNVVGRGNPEAQFEQAFRNIKTLVQSVGGKMEHVVKLTFYMKDMNHLPILRTVRDRHISLANPPASTAVAINGLVSDDFLVEVEATAVVPKVKR